VKRERLRPAKEFGRGIDADDAAMTAGVSVKTIHRHRHEMRYRRIGRRVIISVASFERWLERRTFGRDR
jgi:hypothetical protein